jgi:hypothetical protein
VLVNVNILRSGGVYLLLRFGGVPAIEVFANAIAEQSTGGSTGHSAPCRAPGDGGTDHSTDDGAGHHADILFAGI